MTILDELAVAERNEYELDLFCFVNMFNLVSMIQPIMIKHVRNDN